ncbi:MAG: hypothetical protein PHF84_06600 [bacterium]|nr:hypothetical protein [bacterium]
MKQELTNPSLLADEAGIKNSREPYQCCRCGKEADLDTVLDEKWYFQIDGSEKDLVHLPKKILGFLAADKVRYICPADYRKLPPRSAEKYVEIRSPYFLSVLKVQGGIYCF